MERRTVLLALGTAAIGGCVSGGDGSDNASTEDDDTTPTPTPTPSVIIDESELGGYVSPEDDPDVRPEPLDCEESHYGRLEPEISSPPLGEYDGFSLRVNTLEASLGDEITFTLTNRTDEDLQRGVPDKYNIECRTEDGWEEVRVWTDDTKPEHIDEAQWHDSGEEYEWSFVWDADGIIDEDVYKDRRKVCPELQEGRYRFTFWGVIGGGLAVKFDVRE